jgi:hypothetical protein
MNLILLDTNYFVSTFFHLFFLFLQISTFGPFHRVILEVGYQVISRNLFSISSYQSCKHFFVLFLYYLYLFLVDKLATP